MSIDYKVFGIPGQDNALYCNLNSGQKIFHLLFDCGFCGLHHLGKAILQNIDCLFFSHAHVDHIAGFDTLFRHLYSRNRPLNIFGPRGITDVMKSRFTGFSWNLIDKSPGEMIVHERCDYKIIRTKFLCREAFRRKHHLKTSEDEGIIYENDIFKVKSVTLDHNLECSAYSLQEKDSMNINTLKMKERNLKPGVWCKAIKDNAVKDNDELEIAGEKIKIAKLRSELLEMKKGTRIVYATDFKMTKESEHNLLKLTRDADVLVMESMYLDQDADLAKRNYHLTVSEAACFALKAGVKKLIIFHVSDRYDRHALSLMLNQAREIFPDTFFPVHWKTGDST